MGDLEAQIASAELGVRRFQELMTTYGKDRCQAMKWLMDYTEAMLRREIEKSRRRLCRRRFPRR